MTPYTRWYDYLTAAAIVATLCLLGSWLDRPIEAPVCGTDTACEATLGADEIEGVYYEDLHREAQARQ